MKILLASASPSDVRWATDHGLADGIVTSPARLADERAGDAQAHRELLGELARCFEPACQEFDVGIGVRPLARQQRRGRGRIGTPGEARVGQVAMRVDHRHLAAGKASTWWRIVGVPCFGQTIATMSNRAAGWTFGNRVR